MTVTKESLRAALAPGFPSSFESAAAYVRLTTAARFVERLLPEPCEWCRDGQVEAPITGTDPHGAFAAAPHSTCHGTGQLWDEGLVAVVAGALYDNDPIRQAYGYKPPLWAQLDNDARKPWRVAARAVLSTLTEEVRK